MEHEISRNSLHFFYEKGGGYLYRILENASDKYNINITITLDYEPDGLDYQMFLYDKKNRLLGVAKNNGNGEKCFTLPNWCMQDEEYKLSVRTRDGTQIISEEDYHLVFRENKLRKIYQQMCQKMHFNFVLQKKWMESNSLPADRDLKVCSFQKCEEIYMEQMEVPNQVKEFLA